MLSGVSEGFLSGGIDAAEGLRGCVRRSRPDAPPPRQVCPRIGQEEMAVEGHVVSQRWEPSFISRIARCRKTSSRGCGRADTSGHFLPIYFAEADIHGPSSLIPYPKQQPDTDTGQWDAIHSKMACSHICRRQFPSEALSPQQYALALNRTAGNRGQG